MKPYSHIKYISLHIYLCLSPNRRINWKPSTYSTAECAKVTRPPGRTIVANVTGSCVKIKEHASYNLLCKKKIPNIPHHSSSPLPPLHQVRDEDGSPLPLDQQLLRPPEPRLLHQLLAAGSNGMLTCCHHLHHDHVHTAV